MKILLVTLTFLISYSVMSETSILTITEGDVVLREIDNICADTWCEGDFDYNFSSVSCDSTKGICNLDFEYIYYDWDTESFHSDPYTIKLSWSCELHSFYEKKDVLNSKGDQSYKRITNKFFEAVTECIDENQDKALKKIDDYYKNINEFRQLSRSGIVRINLTKDT